MGVFGCLILSLVIFCALFPLLWLVNSKKEKSEEKINVKSIKTMLLGITVILLGIYIQGEPGIKFYGNEVFIVIAGFVVCIMGLFINN